MDKKPRRVSLLVCSNPDCNFTPLYDAERHQQGIAVKVGKRHYCCRECKKEHTEKTREQK